MGKRGDKNSRKSKGENRWVCAIIGGVQIASQDSNQ